MDMRGHFLRKLTGRVSRKSTFSNRGYCYCCDQAVLFVAEGEWWRDQYVCSNCRCLPRERALMFCIERFFPGWRNMTIHESSPVNRGASLRLKREAPGYMASHYASDIPGGSYLAGIRYEDLESLTFADNSIDLHVTQDVFEHLLDPGAAFKEIARTLRPGGAHVFTTPLVNKQKASEELARRDPQGRIEYLVEPPEYHDAAMSSGGSLVTRHWGHDICSFIYSACGLFTEMVWIDALEFGIRAELIEVLVTRKP